MNANDRVTTFIAVLAMLFVALGIVILNDRNKRHLVRKAEIKQTNPPARYRNNQTSWTMVLGLILFAPILLYLKFFTGWGNALALRPGIFALLITGSAVILVIAVVAAKVLMIQWRGRHFRRAFALVEAGDEPYAIAMLREKLQTDGPSVDVFNALAVIYCHGKDWENALQTVCEAEESGVDDPLLNANKGLILWKLGRVEEAAELLEQAHRILPGEIVVACNYGSLLSELGDADKAEGVLEHVEKILRNTLFLGRDARLKSREIVNELRCKIAAARE